MAGWIVRSWVGHLPSLHHSLGLLSDTSVPSGYSGSGTGRTLGDVVVGLVTPPPGPPVGSVHPSAGDDSVESLECCVNHTGCRGRWDRVKPASPGPLAPALLTCVSCSLACMTSLPWPLGPHHPTSSRSQPLGPPHGAFPPALPTF